MICTISSSSPRKKRRPWQPREGRKPVVDFFKQQKPMIEFTNSFEKCQSRLLTNKVAAIATVWEDDLYTLANKGLVQKTVRPFLLQTGEVGDLTACLCWCRRRNPRRRCCLPIS